MIKTKVTVDDNTPEVIKDLQRKQLSFVTQGGFSIQQNSRIRAPHLTGNLINTIVTESFVTEGVASSETGPTADYAEFVELGTGVHAVKGDGRKTKWSYKSADGRWYTTRGQKPQPFMEPGYVAAKKTFPALAKKVLSL